MKSLGGQLHVYGHWAVVRVNLQPCVLKAPGGPKLVLTFPGGARAKMHVIAFWCFFLLFCLGVCAGETAWHGHGDRPIKAKPTQLARISAAWPLGKNDPFPNRHWVCLCEFYQSGAVSAACSGSPITSCGFACVCVCLPACAVWSVLPVVCRVPHQSFTCLCSIRSLVCCPSIASYPGTGRNNPSFCQSSYVKCQVCNYIYMGKKMNMGLHGVTC